MSHRFTYKEPSGIWGVHGEALKDMSQTMYEAMHKLLDYEETGLSPDAVEDMQSELEKVHIGQKIQNYEIFGMFADYCIAVNKKESESYVVWTIDADKCGVHTGRYCGTKAEAVRIFAECAFGIMIPEQEQSTLSELPEETVLERTRNYCHDFGIPKSIYTDDENSERVRTAARKIQKIRKLVLPESEPNINEVWNNASEIREDIFENIITQLYNILQNAPRNSVRRHFKDVKISEYKKFLNL